MAVWRTTAFLIPRGEFSIVIAALAAPVVLNVNLQALTLAYVILTSFVASMLLRFTRAKPGKR
jgi:CPA2 family monovalent cation:H+ antiporter-2